MTNSIHSIIVIKTKDLNIDSSYLRNNKLEPQKKEGNSPKQNVEENKNENE